MKVSWLKSINDNESFSNIKRMGFEVIELEDLEDTDKTLNNLYQQNYNTVIISNEVASFSQDIIKKYRKNENINIIITPSKRKWIIN